MILVSEKLDNNKMVWRDENTWASEAKVLVAEIEDKHSRTVCCDDKSMHVNEGKILVAEIEDQHSKSFWFDDESVLVRYAVMLAEIQERRREKKRSDVMMRVRKWTRQKI